MNLNDKNFDDLTDDEIDAQLVGVVDEEVVTDTPTPDPEAPSAVVDGAASEPDATPEPEPEKVAGVASKDGTRVLPYAALQSERRSARQNASRATRAEQERDELKQQLEDLKAGKTTVSNDLTEADVVEMEENFPEQGKKFRAAYERTKDLEAKQPKAVERDDDFSDDPIQDAIDQVPLLVGWQHEDPEKFERAQAIDTALQNSPKWRGKPVVERFAHVARQVAQEYDMDVQDDQPSLSKPPSNDPQKVIDTAKRAKPSTLSDFKGGASPDPDRSSMSSMSPTSMVNRFSSMTDDEMDAHLAKFG